MVLFGKRRREFCRRLEHWRLASPWSFESDFETRIERYLEGADVTFQNRGDGERLPKIDVARLLDEGVLEADADVERKPLPLAKSEFRPDMKSRQRCVVVVDGGRCFEKHAGFKPVRPAVGWNSTSVAPRSRISSGKTCTSKRFCADARPTDATSSNPQSAATHAVRMTTQSQKLNFAAI